MGNGGLMMYREIKQCRICGNGNLRKIVDLGVQSLTGVFPKPGEIVGKGPLRLVKCVAEEGESIQVCGLVQLQHSWSGEEMYGNNYGYRSGLNASMVKHLMIARCCRPIISQMVTMWEWILRGLNFQNTIRTISS